MTHKKVQRHLTREHDVAELRLRMFGAMTLALVIDRSQHPGSREEPNVDRAARMVHRILDEVAAALRGDAPAGAQGGQRH